MTTEIKNLESELRKARAEIAGLTLRETEISNELKNVKAELDYQNSEKAKQKITAVELEELSNAAHLASRYSHSIIEASRDPLFTISPSGKITDLNEASVKVTGVERKQLIGTDFFDYFTDHSKARKGYQLVFENGYINDYPLTIADGNLIDVFFNGSVYKDDKGVVLGAVMVARDITDQKIIEKQLIEAKVFAELATALAEEAKGKAESATRVAIDAVKAKQQFLSNMSHEIRTPMNAIIGFTKVLLKTDISIKQKEYLDAIKSSGDALIVLINDILDLAKVDSGKMTFEKTPFKPENSISAILHLFEAKIQEKNLKLIMNFDRNIPKVLLGDSVRLHQIILNLVSNAVKFTSHGEISVAVKLLDQDKSNVNIEFEIADTGIGISDSKIEKIFENFQQASSTTSRIYGGTGLGLAIVKQLVETQGGSIQVRSKLGEGSSFSFNLCFEKTEEIGDTEIKEIEQDNQRMQIRVLVVEDIALNQLLMKTLLDEFGFERDIAANGEIALEKLKSNSYDIILMDLQMPVMNGFETTEYIRNTMLSDIPIMALTADVTTVDLEKCKAVGMNDYISKPIDERLLYNKILGLVKQPFSALKEIKSVAVKNEKQIKCTDLNYLNKITRSDPAMMMEMITVYLEQTPFLINQMKESMQNREWISLSAIAHKIIPSFAIMGISSDYERIAVKVQEYATTLEKAENLTDMVMQLENVCTQACSELKAEFEIIKNKGK